MSTIEFPSEEVRSWGALERIMRESWSDRDPGAVEAAIAFGRRLHDLGRLARVVVADNNADIAERVQTEVARHLSNGVLAPIIAQATYEYLDLLDPTHGKKPT